MAESVTLYPMGVGDAFTARHFFVNCLLTVDGREFFIDAPGYIGKMLATNNEVGEVQIEPDRYKEIFITHMHADHVGGLEELSYFQLYDSSNRPKLYAPDWLLNDIWASLLPVMGYSHRGDGGLANFDWYFEPVPLSNPHDFGSFSVSYGFTRHVPRTLMYKFDFGGFKLGYSPDAAFDRDALAWLDECDLVLHDCWFGETKVLGGDITNIHTPIADLLQMPEDFQKKTLLCHYTDTAYGDDPSQPTEDIGSYRLLAQNKLYTLK